LTNAFGHVLTPIQSTIPHSFLFGHLLVVGKAYAQNAPGAHQQLGIWILLEKHYPELWKQGFYYLDLWPVQYPMLICYETDIISQFTQQKSQPKSVIFKKQFQKLTGGQDLGSTEGAHWKFWRTNFNPGFSARNVLSLVPSFIDDVLLFRQQLEDASISGEVVKLSEPASKLAFDVIGNVVL
jgi:cytochrome P450